MKIKTLLPHRFGKNLLTPVGTISIGENGEFELSTEKARELLLIDPISYVAVSEKTPEKPKVEKTKVIVGETKDEETDEIEDETPAASNEDSEEETTNETPEQKKAKEEALEIQMIEVLKSSSMVDLRGMCEKANLPKDEWPKLLKEPLVLYVARNIKD